MPSTSSNTAHLLLPGVAGDIVSDVLESTGYVVERFANSESAILAWRHESPRVVVLGENADVLAALLPTLATFRDCRVLWLRDDDLVERGRTSIDLVPASAVIRDPAGVLREALRLPEAPARPSALSDGIAQLDHDLRSPLCAIALNLHLLSAQLSPEVDPRVHERVRSIGDCAKRLQEIVDRVTRLKRESRSAVA